MCDVKWQGMSLHIGSIVKGAVDSAEKFDFYPASQFLW